MKIVSSELKVLASSELEDEVKEELAEDKPELSVSSLLHSRNSEEEKDGKDTK